MSDGDVTTKGLLLKTPPAPPKRSHSRPSSVHGLDLGALPPAPTMPSDSTPATQPNPSPTSPPPTPTANSSTHIRIKHDTPTSLQLPNSPKPPLRSPRTSSMSGGTSPMAGLSASNPAASTNPLASSNGPPSPRVTSDSSPSSTNSSPSSVPQRLHASNPTTPVLTVSPSLPSSRQIHAEIVPMNAVKDDSAHQFLLVTVGEHQIAGHGTNKHGLYLVVTVTNIHVYGAKFHQGQLVAPRRYGQFMHLCSKMDPDSTIFGVAPRKRLFSSFEPAAIEERRAYFQKMFNQLAKDKSMRENPLVVQFLDPDFDFPTS